MLSEPQVRRGLALQSRAKHVRAWPHGDIQRREGDADAVGAHHRPASGPGPAGRAGTFARRRLEGGLTPATAAVSIRAPARLAKLSIGNAMTLAREPGHKASEVQAGMRQADHGASLARE